MTVAAVYRGVRELWWRVIPLLASPQGGVAERLKRYREASADREAGVVFRLRTQRKTTPAASASVASQHFLDDAATPPCGDARRGITHQRNSFTLSYSAATVTTAATACSGTQTGIGCEQFRYERSTNANKSLSFFSISGGSCEFHSNKGKDTSR